jgi:DNA primase
MDKGRSAIDEILSKIDIVDLISENVVLKKSGKNYLGLCPFHQEKSPSFNVNSEKQIFRCFGCNVGGNIFEFYKNFHSLTFKEALKELAHRAGVTLTHQFQPTEETTKKDELKSTIYNIYKTSMEFYRWNLAHKQYGEIARGYLKGRNLAAEMIEKFQIGFAQNSWDSLNIYLQKKGFSPDEIKESGLIKERTDGGFYDCFRNRIIFPIQNEKDEVIAFGGRTLDSNQAKYINSPESPIYTKGQNLYALNFAKNKIREKDQVILVEGYLDVISCHEAGFENCVASLGTALTTDQAKKLLRYTTSKKIVVAYDADNAGIKAAEKGTLVLEEVAKGTGINLYILQVPSGKDPDEFLHSEGAAEFQKVIDSAMPIIDFQLEQALSGDLSTPQGKAVIVDKCVEVLLKIKHEIYRGELIKKVVNWQVGSSKLDIREEDLRQRLKSKETAINKENTQQRPQFNNSGNFQNNNFQKNNKNFYKDKNNVNFDLRAKLFSQKVHSKYEKVPGALTAEKGIIYYLVERGRAIEYIKARLEHVNFQDPLNEKIKNTIFEISTNEQKVDWQQLLAIFTESVEQVRVVEIWEGFDNIDVSSDKILKDYLKQVKLNYIKIQRDEIKTDIDDAMQKGQQEIVTNLLPIYTELQKNLKQIESEIYTN